MKEIKFKFYYKNKFLEILSLKQIAEKCEFHWADDVAVCQFTGLKDKNGKEIYEGDIIKDKNTIYKILFDDGSFWAEDFNTDGATEMLSGYFIKKLKGKVVIGNIYENKDLLK